MTVPDRLIGFDGSTLDDTSIVVMARTPDGSWRIESSDGPDAAALAEYAADLVAQDRPASPQPSLAEQVNA